MNHTISLSEELLHLKEDTGWPWKTLAVRVSTVLKDKKPSGSTLFRYAKGISHPADDVEQALLKAIQRIRKREINDPDQGTSRSVEISKRLPSRKRPSSDPLESQDLATPSETETSFDQIHAQVAEAQPDFPVFHESSEKDGLEVNPISKELLHLKEDTGWSWLEIANQIRLISDGESPNGSTLLRYAKGYAAPAADVEQALMTAIQQVRNRVAESISTTHLTEAPEVVAASLVEASAPAPTADEILDPSHVAPIEPSPTQETAVLSVDAQIDSSPSETEASTPDSPISEALIEIKKMSGLSWTKIANEVSSALGNQKISGPTLFRYVKGYLSPTADAEPPLLDAFQKIKERLSSHHENAADSQNLAEPASLSAEISGLLPPTEIHTEAEHLISADVKSEQLPVSENPSLQLQADDSVSLEPSDSLMAAPQVENLDSASSRLESAEIMNMDSAPSTGEEHHLADQLSQELLSLKSDMGWTWRQTALRVALAMPSGAPSFSTLYRYAKGTALPTDEIAKSVLQAIQKCREEPITEASQSNELLDTLITTEAPHLDETEWRVLASIPQPDLAASPIQIEVVQEAQLVVENAAQDERSATELVAQIELPPVAAPITEMQEAVLVVKAPQHPDLSIASVEEESLELPPSDQLSVFEISHPIEQASPDYDPHQDEFVIFCRSRDIFFSQIPEEIAVS
jgi:hypothetical protein